MILRICRVGTFFIIIKRTKTEKEEEMNNVPPLLHRTHSSFRHTIKAAFTNAPSW